MLGRPNVKRRDRRKLGRGQYPQQSPVTTIVTGSGSVGTISFSKPVVVSGPIGMNVEGLTFVSQQITDTQTAKITFSAAVAGLGWEIQSPLAGVVGQKGEVVAAATGTFS